jgi:phospholipid/cholesterol/gamma-HCH transport system permease protein
MQTAPRKALNSSLSQAPAAGRAALRWMRAWWHILRLGALILVLAGTRSTWQRPWRTLIARQVWNGSAPLLLGFGLMSTLLSLVIIRIVLVTAQSYGLSQYALEMVVRVLVLELIPLTAALFVALRVALPAAVELAALRDSDTLARMRRAGADVLRQEVLPRALGVLFAVLLLAAISSVVCLVLAYLLVHGLSPWGLEQYTRLVGRIFNPAVTLIFCLKACGMALAVAVIPLGSALHDPSELPIARRAQAAAGTPQDAWQGAAEESLETRPWGRAEGIELQGLVRLFAALLLIEAASLVGNYV